MVAHVGYVDHFVVTSLCGTFSEHLGSVLAGGVWSPGNHQPLGCLTAADPRATVGAPSKLAVGL